MKINLTGKNITTTDRIEDLLDKKFDRLGKYFSDDIVVNTVLSQERGKVKVEATINAKGAVFRAEEVTEDLEDGIDVVAERLSNQLSRFKGKLKKRYNDNKALKFEFVPEDDEEIEDLPIIKEKQFNVYPMTVEEAILQMEMLQHDFFIFLNMDTDNIGVVYKRKGGSYGLLNPRY